ncbi:MAG TPA: AAA family ATPase [Limnochordales bacterium]
MTTTGVSAPYVERVILKNYKNIAACDVSLQPLTLLVGPNGSGKSNFVDALRFVADALRTTLEHALRDRGGIHEVRRRSRGHPTHFGIRLTVNLGTRGYGWYAFQIGAQKQGSFNVQREECWVSEGGKVWYFRVENGKLQRSSERPLPDSTSPDRLYLPLVSGLSGFRALYDALSHMGFYNLNPERIRDLQDPDPGQLLERDGRNLASVVRRIADEQPELAQRINEYLSSVVPGVSSVVARSIGPKETLEFRQKVAGDEAPWRFLAANMSDGTLRVLGVLVATFQATASQIPPTLVAIEEPEVAIHPGAAVKLMDALLEASRRTRLLITTHSPELLDHPDVDPASILAVEARDNESIITPVRAEMRQVIKEQLYSVGELLRLEQLRPDEQAYQHIQYQLRLFPPDGDAYHEDRADR